MENSLINQIEAARILGIDRTTLWRWIRTNKIKVTTKLNNRTPLFDRNYIELLAETREQQEAAVA